MKKIVFPREAKFAFTIFDDTDNARIENIKPIYDLLADLGIKTTKSVWPLPVKPGDKFTGESLQDEAYLNFILALKQKGFEIALHNVGSGKFTRNEIINGLEEYKNKIGEYPNIHVNHSYNPDNIYWGYKRFGFPFKQLYKSKNNHQFYGEESDSPHFWADIFKEHCSYIRSHTFNGLNTLKFDPYMPYKEKAKEKFTNFWFSSTDTPDVDKFNQLVTPVSIDKLEAEQGVCILYTHFASGFCVNGKINNQFKSTLQYLAKKNALFIPVSPLLDLLRNNRGPDKDYISKIQKLKLDFRFFKTRI